MLTEEKDLACQNGPNGGVRACGERVALLFSPVFFWPPSFSLLCEPASASWPPFVWEPSWLPFSSRALPLVSCGQVWSRRYPLHRVAAQEQPAWRGGIPGRARRGFPLLFFPLLSPNFFFAVCPYWACPFSPIFPLFLHPI